MSRRLVLLIVATLVAIEVAASVQGLKLAKSHKTDSPLSRVVKAVHERVRFLDAVEPLTSVVAGAKNLLING